MNWSNLSYGAMAEVAVGVAMLAMAIWIYRRPAAGGTEGSSGYGSQSAVILLIIAAILLIHGLGALEYHPTEGEIEMMKARGR